MKWLMRKCTNCSRYTLKTTCPACGSPANIPHPAKFSPDDKYAKYRVESLSNRTSVESAADKD